MRRIVVAFLCAATVLSLTACTGQGEKDRQESEAGMELEQTSVETETGSSAETKIMFPDSYTGGTEKVRLDFVLEIPEEFDPLQFYVPKVNGLHCIDQDTAYAEYVEGKEIQEQYNYPANEQTVVDEGYYIFPDGGMVSIAAGIDYVDESFFRYSRVEPLNEERVSKEEFSFKTAETCIAEVKEKLAAIKFPEEKFRFSWLSVRGEEWQKLETECLENQMLDPEKAYGSWTESDNAYRIYAWQTYGGLDVLPLWMTTRMKRINVGYAGAPLSATYTEQGMLQLNTGKAYDFEATQELASFAEFPEVASTIISRYDNLLDDAVYTVNRAKLVIRVYYDENQQFAAVPVWYFEVTDSNGNFEMILVDALTAKEIYLDP